jgi:1,2-phenylacetyl-CoA epoxidase PaaB subunit
MKYHVFTRVNAGDDLMHVGTVQADSDRLARIYAHRTYDEEDWDFIGVVREENLIEVEEQPIAGGRAP